MKKPTLLIDTNIVSYALKRDSRAMLYTQHLAGERPALSFFTIAELYRWAAQYRWHGSKRGRLDATIHSYVALESNDKICRTWAQLKCIPGQPIDSGDAWIAATALSYRLPLVTHNRSHFDHIVGLDLISEA